MIHTTVCTLLALFTFSLASFGWSKTTDNIQWHSKPHINVALITTPHPVKPNTYFTGVVFKPEKGWHVYWRNAGDTGLPPKIEWGSEQNISFQSLQWPFPEAIPFLQLVNYGYHDEALIFSEATIKSTEEATELSIEANVEWLVCKESCIPGKIQLSEKLIDSKATPLIKQKFSDAQARLPKPLPLLGSDINFENGTFTVSVYAKELLFQNAASVEVFPVELDIIEYSSPAKLFWKKNLVRLEQPLSEYFVKAPESLNLVVVVDKKNAYHFELPTK